MLGKTRPQLAGYTGCREGSSVREIGKARMKEITPENLEEDVGYGMYVGRE
jgi:hypothetical protein